MRKQVFHNPAIFGLLALLATVGLLIGSVVVLQDSATKVTRMR